MNILEVIKCRRSCRQFVDKQIDKDILLKLVEAGVDAPSGFNSQNYRFLIIDNKDEIQRLGTIKPPHKLTKTASAWIVVFCDNNAHTGFNEKERHIWSKIWYHNCGAAIQNIILASTYYKIGSCWISFVDEMNGTRLIGGKTWKELFSDYNIPDTYSAHGIVLLGYPHEVDENGYPKGDDRHGHKPVVRPPVDKFLIRSTH